MQEMQRSSHCFSDSAAHASKSLIHAPVAYSRQAQRVPDQWNGGMCVVRHLRFTTPDWRQEGRETPVGQLRSQPL